MVEEDGTHDKAKGKPGTTLDDMPRDIAAMMALAYDVFIPRYRLAESLLAAGKKEENHDGKMKSRIFRSIRPEDVRWLMKPAARVAVSEDGSSLR